MPFPFIAPIKPWIKKKLEKREKVFLTLAPLLNSQEINGLLLKLKVLMKRLKRLLVGMGDIMITIMENLDGVLHHQTQVTLEIMLKMDRYMLS